MASFAKTWSDKLLVFMSIVNNKTTVFPTCILIRCCEMGCLGSYLWLSVICSNHLNMSSVLYFPACTNVNSLIVLMCR